MGVWVRPLARLTHTPIHPYVTLTTALCLCGLICRSSVAAPAPVSFSRQVLPVLQKQCMACHGPSNGASGFSIVSRESILKGGRHGAAVLPGKGTQSSLVKYLTGELKPKMPPGGAIDLETIGLIRRWIDEGARVDSMSAPISAAPATGTRLSRLPSAANLPAPVTALAYSPDGNLLAAGGYRVVRLLNPATGEVVRTISGAADQVHALAWSSDGKLIAAGGGTPGLPGEIILFNVDSGAVVRKLPGHAETVYSVAWKPNSTELASGALDKTVRIWDTLSGASVRTIKDHADAVFSVAYSPDGKLLATGSADRSAKLIDTTNWKRSASLTAHQDAVTRVAFSPDGKMVATAGADKQVRIWPVKTGTIENPLRSMGEGDVINACAFSPDGSLFVWGATNKTVRVFNGDGSQQKRELKDAEDWVYAVGVGADNQTIAAGTQDGKVLFWDAKEGKLLRTVTLSPKLAKLPISPGAAK
jgi:hypothetical protein